MYKILRIICCVIAALLLAACIFVFVYLGVIWGLCTVVGAAAFFALTILFKSLQEDCRAAPTFFSYYYNILSMKSSGAKSSRSSIFSPTPAKITGISSSPHSEITKPPLAEPSNLVKTIPSSSTALSNTSA